MRVIAHLLLSNTGQENSPENSRWHSARTRDGEAGIAVILRSLETVSQKIYSDPTSVLFLIFAKMFFKLLVRVCASNLADVASETAVICKTCVHKSEVTAHLDNDPV